MGSRQDGIGNLRYMSTGKHWIPCMIMGHKQHLPRFFFLPSWIGIVTSLAFLGISIVLLIHESPTHLVIGQLAQYCLSTAIWWYVAFPTSVLHNVDERIFLYGDRLTAVSNIYFLGWYFIENSMIEYSHVLITLAFTVAFKIFDALAKPGNMVSIWYVFWHLNLFANNTTIICCGMVLPIYTMAGQHVLALLLTASLRHYFPSYYPLTLTSDRGDRSR